jgi:hypothetical protein
MKRRKLKLGRKYGRRSARSLTKSPNRSQARNRPAPKKRFAFKRKLAPFEQNKLAFAVKEMKAGKSLTAMARELGVTARRLRNNLGRLKLLRKCRGRWLVSNARIPIKIYSHGEIIETVVPKRAQRSLASRYLNAVRRYRITNEPLVLADFAGASVTDDRGVEHPFEVDPNTLHVLADRGVETAREFYRYPESRSLRG